MATFVVPLSFSLQRFISYFIAVLA